MYQYKDYFYGLGFFSLGLITYFNQKRISSLEKRVQDLEVEGDNPFIENNFKCEVDGNCPTVDNCEGFCQCEPVD